MPDRELPFKKRIEEKLNNTKDSIYWGGIENEYKNRRPINAYNMEYIYKVLTDSGVPEIPKHALIGSIMEESGGDPSATSPDGEFYGLTQWEASRYDRSLDEGKSEKEKLDNQLKHLLVTLKDTTDDKSWTHGGDGSGFSKGSDAMKLFFSTDNLYIANKALNRGYIRPSGKDKSVDNRYKASKLINKYTLPKKIPYITAPNYEYNEADKYINAWERFIPAKKIGGKFTPKKSKLVKNAEEQNSKRDMRKKFIKSDRPTYTNNRVKKNQSGGVLSVDPSIFVSWNNISTSNIKLPEVDYTPKSNLDRFLERTENSVSINLLGNPKEQEEKQDQKEIPVSKEEPIVKKTPLANPSKGNDAFNKIYDELISEMPDAAEYRDFLTTVAKYESGFDSRAKNKYAPAWGYFQFMQDDNKYNNIKSYAGVDTQTFLNNPKLQIRAAINLAKAMEKGFTKEDIEAAKSKGISRWGMLGGAWLGGNGGLRKYLLQNINSSDKHWNPEGKGIDMENQIRRYNF